MASLYILYSPKANIFYIGYTKDIDQRFEYHLTKEFSKSFSAKYDDWELFFTIDELSVTVAKKIETHLKRMKSKTYLKTLKQYPEKVAKLISKYS